MLSTVLRVAGLAWLFAMVSASGSVIRSSKQEKQEKGKITASYIQIAAMLFVLDGVAVCAFVWVAVMAVQDGDSALPFIGMIIGMSAFCLGIGIPCALWKLELTDDGIVYRDWIGRSHHYAYTDVTGCRITRGYDYVFYHDDRKLFAVGGHLKQVISQLIFTKKIPVTEVLIATDKDDGTHAVRPLLGGEIAVGVFAAILLGCVFLSAAEGRMDLVLACGILFLCIFLTFLAQLMDKTWIEDKTVCQRKLFRKTKRIRYAEIGRIVRETGIATNEPLIVFYDRKKKKRMYVYRNYRGTAAFEEELKRHFRIW
jgi:hypothetical protein